MGDEHNTKVLKDFKRVVKHQISLLRRAAKADTAYFYWINRRRRQFVLEARSTRHNDVMFQDRVPFEDHYLDRFRDLDERESVNVGKGATIPVQALEHHLETVNVRRLELIPLIHGGETVAMTVLEFEEGDFDDESSSVIESYVDGLQNMMETYMEITRLSKGEEQWEQYEKELEAFLDDIAQQDQPQLALWDLARHITAYLSKGGAVLLIPHGSKWRVAADFYTSLPDQRIREGLIMENKSIAAHCLDRQETHYISHLNGSPKRISSREPEHRGASLAVPLWIAGQLRAVMVVFDENPLIFTASTRHRIENLVRCASREISLALLGKEQEEPFHHEQISPLLKRPVWERLLRMRVQQDSDRESDCTIAAVQIENIQQLRTQLRLKQLQNLENRLLSRLDSVNADLSNFLGYYKPYHYVILCMEPGTETANLLRNHLKKVADEPFDIFEEENPVYVELDFRFEQIEQIKELQELETRLLSPESR